ncbi:hypothetical protein K493DRAFT_339083 [Basidiobolus meristosporus CBS 931.73]|uniref:RING-type domain-containing protein n=1 Tax=Basidiobolus meristosporus CBS 931.73 TaxID=1314790 RepID=A0A1Y1Y2C6_9FUNG|nr:hypothetical protein K493DRAFT_339083 [Basidiobolus meristosporus CBS 931.73]|eukprot:ORX91876.1 hypothetical protein K493DRAFT_339083 [Basidiobolus meristosporus CBS 931.73]
MFRFYLIASVVRHLLSIPLMGVYYLHPEGHNTHCPTTLFLSWVCRVRSILNFFGTMLFLFGNYIIFTSLYCSSGSPAMYGLTLALIILGYLRFIIPAILCAAVICLPCLIVVLRALNIAEVLETGANLESIAKLNIVRYRKAEPETTTSGKDSTDVLHVTTPLPVANRRNPFTRVLLKVFRRNKKESQQVVDVEKGEAKDGCKVVQLSDEDAVCCICLEEYVDGEKLREMRCAHYFHVSCIDEWLQLNRTCPLCKRDMEFAEGSSPATHS